MRISHLSKEIIVSIVVGLLSFIIQYVLGHRLELVTIKGIFKFLPIFISLLAFLLIIGRATTFKANRIHKLLRKKISWRVVWAGADRLFNQLVRSRREFPAGDTMFIGVNALGTAIGVAIAYRYTMDIPIPIGMVHTCGGDCDRVIRCINYPDSIDELRRSIKHVLIIDGLMKTGYSAKIIKDRILQDFPDTNIQVAVLILCRLDLSNYKNWEEIPSSVKTPRIKPDFIAYFTNKDTVHLPWKLR